MAARLMRQLTSNGIFKEVSLGEWEHNRRSGVYSILNGTVASWTVRIAVDEMGTAILQLSEYLDKYGFKDIKTYNDSPYSWAHRELGLSFFEVLSKHPHRMEAFSRGLAEWEKNHPVLGIFPFENLLQGNSPHRPLMVDVGGGRGRSLLTVRKAYPELKGEMILQDTTDMLDNISPSELPEVTKMPHDFFTKNPVRNAQVYWIRRVFHDWQDAEGRKIIEAIAPAMATDSRILISDMLIPEPVTAQDSNALWLDLMMMTIGGKERTAKDFDVLCEGTPVEVVKIWQSDKTRSCVVEIMRRDRGIYHSREKDAIPGSVKVFPKETDNPQVMSFVTNDDEGVQPPQRVKINGVWYRREEENENMPRGPVDVPADATPAEKST
ncbi:MAG: hypothetical protein Q9227_007719 [Pyrenula ochraceoflavens]